MDLAADFEFAEENKQEFVSRNGGATCPLLRYVVAINPECSKEDFVAAAVARGYNGKTAKIQFVASRKFMTEMDAEEVS